MSVKIITDSISDISQSAAKKYDIEVLPVKLIMDGKHLATKDIAVEEMVKWIEDNEKVPEFLGIKSQKYGECFNKYIDQGDDIVCITSGSMAISNYDSALHASTKFPDANIHVINTNRFSGSVGLLSVMAAKMANRNESANAIAFMCEKSVDKNKQISLMNSFDFLKYAGAVPKIIAAGTNLFNAKFAFSMNKGDDRDAEILAYNMEKAIKKFCKKVFSNLSEVKPETVFLTYTISEEDYISKVYQCAVEADYFDDIVMCRSSHFNTSFVGRSCMTVTYQMK